MEILGEKLFAKDAAGRLVSRVATLFLGARPTLVTLKGIHATQRLAWLDAVDAARAKEGRPPLSETERADTVAQSVDLVVTEEAVLIRPDPERMDLACRADEELQKIVSKRRIRFLNTHAARVRDALRARGENWRMAREIRSREDVDAQIAEARTAILHEPIFYYNRKTGTRYLTVGSYEIVKALPDDRFRGQIAEIVHGLNAVNRLGRPEIDLFPPAVCADVRATFRALKPDALDDAALRAAVGRIETAWRMAMPPELRVEDAAVNLEWRAEMSATLSKSPNETVVGDQQLIQGISPEFYRQVEWLPGARVENGRIIFDALFDEAQRTHDPELEELCDVRVRSIIFNLMRLFSTVDYVNIGRIPRSLVRHPVKGRRGSVYIVQYKEQHSPLSRVFVIRFQKWGIAEHLDEGKDLLTAMIEANNYADYILDRRLMCRQLGMKLPAHVGFGQFTEPYRGNNQYNGTTVRASYFVRAYVPGVASDKVPPEKFRNAAFAQRFAELMGAAAATDLIVGRRATEADENIFDRNYEVLQLDPRGMPVRLTVTDHAGSFVQYKDPYETFVAPYANVVRRREAFVPDYAAFCKAYVTAFSNQLAETQRIYRACPAAFDNLFEGRPFDLAGSGAYRWSCVLKRLDACDPAAVTEALKRAIRA